MLTWYAGQESNLLYPPYKSDASNRLASSA
jgi:hypothetical protein